MGCRPNPPTVPSLRRKGKLSETMGGLSRCLGQISTKRAKSRLDTFPSDTVSPKHCPTKRSDAQCFLENSWNPKSKLWSSVEFYFIFASNLICAAHLFWNARVYVLKRTDFTCPLNYQSSVAPQRAVGLHRHLPAPCCDFFVSLEPAQDS